MLFLRMKKTLIVNTNETFLLGLEPNLMYQTLPSCSLITHSMAPRQSHIGVTPTMTLSRCENVKWFRKGSDVFYPHIYGFNAYQVLWSSRLPLISNLESFNHSHPLHETVLNDIFYYFPHHAHNKGPPRQKKTLDRSEIRSQNILESWLEWKHAHSERDWKVVLFRSSRKIACCKLLMTRILGLYVYSWNFKAIHTFGTQALA